MCQSEKTPESEQEIVRVYSQPGCGFCKEVKDYLTREGIPFKDYDLTTDREGQVFMNEKGYTALPVTVINGQDIIGLNLDKIREALGR